MKKDLSSFQCIAITALLNFESSYVLDPGLTDLKIRRIQKLDI